MSSIFNLDLRPLVGLRPNPRPVYNLPALAAPPLAQFSITRLAHQLYAEVETSFVGRHMGQLGGYWSIKKTDTSYHTLRFNDDYENPLILAQGWNKFKEWHCLPDNVQIELMYFGNKIFEISAIHNLDLALHLPPYHSRSLHPVCTARFDLKLNPINIRLSKLFIRDDLAAFICMYGLRYVLLCGENGGSFKMKVLNIGDKERMKLGRNWDEFCEDQKFKAGDSIRMKFKVDFTSASPRCHVYKLNG